MRVGGCMGGLGGAALRAEMYKTELGLPSSRCPVHPTAGPALAQPVLTCFYSLLDSLETVTNCCFDEFPVL